MSINKAFVWVGLGIMAATLFVQSGRGLIVMFTKLLAPHRVVNIGNMQNNRAVSDKSHGTPIIPPKNNYQSERKDKQKNTIVQQLDLKVEQARMAAQSAQNSANHASRMAQNASKMAIQNVNGYKVQIWPNGQRYEGEVRHNKRSGYGVYIWPNGQRFEGVFENDKYKGYGIYMWPNGNRYAGKFLDEKKNGYGIFYWQNGDHFEGEFQNGKINGHGIKISGNGSVLKSGLWVNEELIH